MPIDLSLDAPAPTLVKVRGKYKRVAFLSDIHAPFHDKRALSEVWRVLAEWKPDLAVLGGDIVDFYGASDHDKDPDRNHTLQYEFDSASEAIFKPLDALVPAVSYLPGNHENRLFRTVRKHPELFSLRALSLRSAMELPEHWDVYQSQTHLRIGKLLYLHGDLAGRGSGTRHAAAGMLDKLRTNCIFGHLHRVQSAIRTDYEGHSTGAWANGHLSDVSTARYVANPDWQAGFSLIEYSDNMAWFQVYQILIHKGKAVWG